MAAAAGRKQRSSGITRSLERPTSSIQRCGMGGVEHPNHTITRMVPPAEAAEDRRGGVTAKGVESRKKREIKIKDPRSRSQLASQKLGLIQYRQLVPVRYRPVTYSGTRSRNVRMPQSTQTHTKNKAKAITAQLRRGTASADCVGEAMESHGRGHGRRKNKFGRKMSFATKMVLAGRSLSSEFSEHRHHSDHTPAARPDGVPLDGHDDLCQLNAFDADLILDTLQMRHHLQTVYTRIGARCILISINPYCKVRPHGNQFYGSFAADRYYKAALEGVSSAVVLPPHVYEISADAYMRCLGVGPVDHSNRKDQTVVATGESGAGKTENVRQILDFVASSCRQGSSRGAIPLQRMLSDTNCILVCAAVSNP